MFLVLLIFVPMHLFGNKEEVRAQYPEIWAALEKIQYVHSPSATKKVPQKIDPSSFTLEKKVHIAYTESVREDIITW